MTSERVANKISGVTVVIAAVVTDLVSKTGPVQFTKNLENASSYEKSLSRETIYHYSALQLGKKPSVVHFGSVQCPLKTINKKQSGPFEVNIAQSYDLF